MIARLLFIPRRDPGCAREAAEFLRPFVGQFRHALVIFDHEGSGKEDKTPHVLASEIQGRLASTGWEDSAEVVVIRPELESWVFAQSPHVEVCLGWVRRGRLKPWLEAQGLWSAGSPKPESPRKALERILLETKKPRSSALYQALAKRVSTRGCTDAAFGKLRDTLVRWFPGEATRQLRI